MISPADLVESASIAKMSVKWFEVPIQKFNSAVPHFVSLLKVHQDNITKLKRLNQWDEAQREHKCALRTAKQLMSLVNEMDLLRNQVVDAELSKFDKLISSSKRNALNAINSHKAMEIGYPPTQYVEGENTAVISNNDEQNQQLQTFADLSEQIKRQEQHAAYMDGLQGDVEDVHALFQDLSLLVHHQGEQVEKIEDNVAVTHHNVVEGESLLCQAVKFKNGMYPLVGALIGSVMGGPVGLLAGMKLGSLTAVGCGVLGFTGGKILKNLNDVSPIAADHLRQQLTM